ncbi:MAG: tetratricopeptide repeat protein, partial [Okeania sp. SIO4D6]|nr:tetratricopeptide repeat protein [Okeania sp. SIO4D6]
GDVLEITGKSDQAITSYLKAIELNPEIDRPHLCLWNLFLKQDKWEKAEKIYRQEIEKNPRNFWLWNYLGNTLVKQQRLDEAIASYQKALSIQPNISEIYQFLGDAFIQQQRWDEAAIIYLRAVELNPELSWSNYNLWNTLERCGKLDKVVNLYRQFIQQNPDSYLSYINLGEILTKQNQIDEAIIYYQTACYQQTLKSYPSLCQKQWNLTDIQSPNFLIIGVGKGGTTSLFSYLIQHPQILSPVVKEINFWSMNFNKGINWYLSHFPTIPNHENLITGEASPSYLGNWEAPDRIFNYFPEIKLIIMLRNPVDRAISHYYHWRRINRENRPLETALKEELENWQIIYKNSPLDTNYWHHGLYYLGTGIYIDFIHNWMRIFPQEQILILPTEEFYRTPTTMMKRVFDFLGLPNYKVPDYQKLNLGSYPPISKSLHQKLTNFFRPHNQKLEEYLEMTFHWETRDG